MKTFYLPLLLTISGGLLYHVGIKSVSTSANPFLALFVPAAVLTVVYAVCALTISVDGASATAARGSGWGILAVGVGAVLIELGFLWAYRQGWELSRAALTTTVSVTLLLAASGLILFREQLSLRYVLGVVCCIAGLVLITRGK